MKSNALLPLLFSFPSFFLSFLEILSLMTLLTSVCVETTSIKKWQNTLRQFLVVGPSARQCATGKWTHAQKEGPFALVHKRTSKAPMGQKAPILGRLERERSFLVWKSGFISSLILAAWTQICYGPESFFEMEFLGLSKLFKFCSFLPTFNFNNSIIFLLYIRSSFFLWLLVAAIWYPPKAARNMPTSNEGFS